MKLNLVLQDPDDQCCSAACVAMLCGIGLYTACWQLNSYGKTRLKTMLRLLAQYGWRPAPESKTALVLVHKGRSNHWVLHHEAQWFDPEDGVSPTLPPSVRVVYRYPISRS